MIAITLTAFYILSIASAMDTSTVSTTHTSTFTTSSTSFLIEKGKLSYTAVVIITVLSISFMVCLASACSPDDSGFNIFHCIYCIFCKKKNMILNRVILQLKLKEKGLQKPLAMKQYACVSKRIALKMSVTIIWLHIVFVTFLALTIDKANFVTHTLLYSSIKLSVNLFGQLLLIFFLFKVTIFIIFCIKHET